MPVVSLRCPHCGGDLELENSKEFGFCQFCGTKIMIQKQIEKMKLDESGKKESLLALLKSYIHDKAKATGYADKILEIDANCPLAWYVKLANDPDAGDRLWKVAMKLCGGPAVFHSVLLKELEDMEMDQSELDASYLGYMVNENPGASGAAVALTDKNVKAADQNYAERVRYHTALIEEYYKSEDEKHGHAWVIKIKERDEPFVKGMPHARGEESIFPIMLYLEAVGGASASSANSKVDEMRHKVRDRKITLIMPEKPMIGSDRFEINLDGTVKTASSGEKITFVRPCKGNGNYAVEKQKGTAGKTRGLILDCCEHADIFMKSTKGDGRGSIKIYASSPDEIVLKVAIDKDKHVMPDSKLFLTLP